MVVLGSVESERRSGCAHAPPGGKIFNAVEAPNHIYSRRPIKFQLTQLLPDIWSPLFPIGLTLRGPEMGFLGFKYGGVWGLIYQI